MFFNKKRQIAIQGNQVDVVSIDGNDYISLTDMLKSKDGEFFVKDWLRNRNTLEFLSVWEAMHNPSFNPEGFSKLTEQAGLNSFKISVKEWIEQTNAKGIVAKTGRYGGTYAHIDIAFEFGTWISPTFKLYLIKEYQRLKQLESNEYNLEWNVKRMMTKLNYTIHTDAIKNHIIPHSTKWRKDLEYAEEADLLNVAVFGVTAKDWRLENPDRVKNNENIRDIASINELAVLSNMESYNARMIKDGLGKEARFIKIREDAQSQLASLNNKDFLRGLKKTSEAVYIIEDKSGEK